LGGFIGSNASKVDWFGGMVTTWVAAVETLASVAGNYPQAAYAGFTFCLQNEWQYMQRVTSDTATHFAPLEVAIRTKFLLALLGIATSDLDGEFRELLTHGVKTGGIAIRNPVDTAVHVHETSLCLEMRKDFTPLVYSVDGIAGREAKNAEKRTTPPDGVLCSDSNGHCRGTRKQPSDPRQQGPATSPPSCYL
jgi:hypothetical protein